VDGLFEILGGSNAPGIGAGSSSRGNSSVNRLVIENGRFSVAGQDLGSGIGNVASQTGLSSLIYLAIGRGVVNASGYYGIGNVTEMELMGDGDLELNCTVSQSSCISAASLKWRNGTFSGKTNADTFVSPLAEVASESVTVYGEYAARSSLDSFGRPRLLHIGYLPAIGGDVLELSVSEGGQVKFAFELNRSHTAGLIASMENPGLYELRANGQLLCFGGQSTLSIGEGENFFPEVVVCTSSQLSEEALIGIIAGSAAVFVIIVVAIVVCVCRMHRSPSARPTRERRKDALIDPAARSASGGYTTANEPLE
jgi:hypothetical protein